MGLEVDQNARADFVNCMGYDNVPVSKLGSDHEIRLQMAGEPLNSDWSMVNMNLLYCMMRNKFI